MTTKNDIENGIENEFVFDCIHSVGVRVAFDIETGEHFVEMLAWPHAQDEEIDGIQWFKHCPACGEKL